MEQEKRDELGVEQVRDTRFTWATGVNQNTWYYEQYWIQRLPSPPKWCVIKRRDNGMYYVSDPDDDEGVRDEGPFNSLEDAASVCVMKNYGN